MDYRFAAPIENDFLNIVSRVDYKAADNHSFFARVGKQDDTINNPPQFPDLAPRRQRLFNNWGGAVGYDAVLSPTLTNSFRYGFTKIDENNAGVTDANYVVFRFISPYEGKGDTNTFTDTRQTPTQNFVNDLSWFKGRHTMKAGTNLRFTRVPKNRFQASYLSATINPSWVAGIGRRNMPGSAFCTVPGCSIPAVATAFQAGYADAWLNIIGVLSQATQRANYDQNGVPQAPGTPVAREYASDEYEWYIQDAWQLRPNLTVTAGLRYSLYSPPYETNGLQVAPSVSMGQWFDQRAQNAANGIPSSASEIVTFDLAGPKNNRPGFYAWDKNNFAPRLAVAWTPAERLVLRGGYSKVFDRVGVGLATTFDEGFAFGMSTQISSPFGAAYETNPGARFVNITTMPSDHAGGAGGWLPADPASARGYHHVEHRRHAGDAVGAHDQRHHRLRLEPELLDRGGLHRTLRPRHAGPP